jgi:hypothetical protein
LWLREVRRGKRSESGDDGLTRTDWLASAALIAKHAPGFGNPLSMPIDLFVAVVESVCDMIQAESGRGGRASVDREMRRLLG